MDPILPSSAFGAVGTLALLFAIAGSALAEQIRSATALALRNITLPPSRRWRAAGLALGAALGAALAAIPNPALLTWVAIAMAAGWTAGHIAPLPAVLRPLTKKAGKRPVRNALGAATAGVVLTVAAVYEWPVVRHHVAGVVVATLIGIVAIRRPWRWISSRRLLAYAGALGFIVAAEVWLRTGIAAAGWYMPVFAALAAAVAGCVASSSARAGLLEAIGLKEAAAGTTRAAERVSRIAAPSALAGGLAGMVAVPASGARWLAFGALAVVVPFGRRRIAALIDTAAPEPEITVAPDDPGHGALPGTTDGYLSLRSPITWVRLVVLSLIGGVAYTMLYGTYAIAGSIAASTGVPKEVIVTLPAAGLAVAVTLLLPYTALKAWITPASLAAMAGIALLIGRADGLAVVPLIFAGGCCFLAPFSLWARVGATLPKGKAGDRVGHVFPGLMLATVTGIGWLFGRAVGEIGPGTRERVEGVFFVFAIALAVSALVAWWLTPRLPQAELEARQRKTGHPIVRPWLQLRDPHIRRVAWLYGLSGATLGMFDSTITLAILAAMLTEEHSAGTGIAIIFGAVLAPALNFVIRTGRARMLVAGCVTLAGLAVAAVFGGTGEAAAALLPVLIAGRTGLETGTSQTTLAGPDVVRGDEDVMSVLQAFKAFLQAAGTLLAALVLFRLGPDLGLTGWRLVLLGAGLAMLTYLLLAAGLPREQPIVQELPDGTGYEFRHGGAGTYVVRPGALPRLLKSVIEATPRGPRPVRVFYGYGQAEGPSAGRADLRLGSALLQDMESLAEAWPGVTKVTNADLAWVRDRFVGVVGVVFADASDDAKPRICEPLAHQLREELGLGLVLVGERHVPASPAWRSRTRKVRLAGRHVKALAFARLAGLRPLGRTSPTRSWMRLGENLGVGNILGSEVRRAAEQYGVETETWSIEPVDDGWKLCVEAEGNDRQLAAFEAYLAASLRLTGISGVDVERRPESVTA